jgi:hypothetical protein
MHSSIGGNFRIPSDGQRMEELDRKAYEPCTDQVRPDGLLSEPGSSSYGFSIGSIPEKDGGDGNSAGGGRGDSCNGGCSSRLERIMEFVMRWNGFHRIKHVGVSPQVLATYHKSLLYGELPLSGRLRRLIRRRNVIYVWYVVSHIPDDSPSFIENSLSLCVCVCAYACTYIAHLYAYIHAYTYTSR